MWFLLAYIYDLRKLAREHEICGISVKHIARLLIVITTRIEHDGMSTVSLQSPTNFFQTSEHPSIS